MDNVQKHNICTNVPSSQTFRSYVHNKQLHNVYPLLRKVESAAGTCDTLVGSQCIQNFKESDMWNLGIDEIILKLVFVILTC
jgi:hypothetical protein